MASPYCYILPQRECVRNFLQIASPHLLPSLRPKKTHVSMISMKNVRWKHFLYGSPMVVMVQDCLYKLFPYQAEKEDLTCLFYPIVLTVITPSMPRIFSMIESSILFSTSIILYATFALFWLTIAAMFIFASARTVVI